MKKLLSWAIVICMVLSMMPVTAQAASGSCGENVSWSLENGVLTISGTGATNDYTTGQTPWYSSRNAIRSVVVTDGVTRIGNGLLERIAAVSVTLPDSVTEIGEYAFQYCEQLETAGWGRASRPSAPVPFLFARH